MSSKALVMSSVALAQSCLGLCMPLSLPASPKHFGSKASWCKICFPTHLHPDRLTYFPYPAGAIDFISTAVCRLAQAVAQCNVAAFCSAAAAHPAMHSCTTSCAHSCCNSGPHAASLLHSEAEKDDRTQDLLKPGPWMTTVHPIPADPCFLPNCSIRCCGSMCTLFI
jgi:hypothetical protein